ncbi:MAG: Gfo/Idh/MocA family oxidoreductase [Actinobacteria bacterium]|nr:Gfo/Idh/MocA family oxidoreductase [Actinomycetota bacterium]MBV8396702.1 Gfo/Idh/MocA family oxidoreductase [Actinomycetota bacterium]
MPERVVRVGIVGGGLMGREIASATARWLHLSDLGVRPEIVAVCDPDPRALAWFERVRPTPRLVADYRDLLADESVEAVYCAVPHHLHAEVYVACLEAGKHLLGEKPFGIDLAAYETIERAAAPRLLVRCSSELPFFPGGQAVWRWLAERRYGRVLEVRSLFLHSSDLDPGKPINWKRVAATNGEYGVMGDLGLHVLHLPLRAGFRPRDVRALLTNVVAERPGSAGSPVPCDTWDNAVLLCEAEDGGDTFPLRVETKRIAPGEMNTWTIEVDGTDGSIAFTTKLPKTLRTMAYAPGGPQEWRVTDLGSQSAYPSISGAVFEFGFSDAIQQMWAAFLDELAHGRDGMRQPFHCATPEEVGVTHRLFTAALRSQRERAVVAV